jgi:hypothetical protein
MQKRSFCPSGMVICVELLSGSLDVLRMGRILNLLGKQSVASGSDKFLISVKIPKTPSWEKGFVLDAVLAFRPSYVLDPLVARYPSISLSCSTRQLNSLIHGCPIQVLRLTSTHCNFILVQR